MNEHDATSLKDGPSHLKNNPDNGAEPQRKRETAVFALGPKSQNGPKIHFSNYGVLSVSNKPALTAHRLG